MSTIFNKTALNKIKKADLIEMFLKQQARKINDDMCDDQQIIKNLEKEKRLLIHNALKENNKLKEEKGMAEIAHRHLFDEMTKDLMKLKEANDEPENTQYWKDSHELLRDENEKLKDMVEQYSQDADRATEAESDNEKLKDRVKIMEKCKKLWYDKCQEDPDDDPDFTGIKWSICLEGGLNYWMKEAIHQTEENQNLLDDIELHPDYEDTIQSTIETALTEPAS